MGIKWFLFVFHPHHLVNQLSGHGPPCVCVCVCVFACVRVRLGRQVALPGPAACERTTPACHPTPPGPGACERTTAPASLL